MYYIKCDDYPLFDPRDDELIVESPKVNLEVNTVGEGSFTIHKNHPYYSRLLKLKSVFEVSDEIGVIFRGRMTNNSYDFYNSKFVDLEGAMAYFNDSKVRPYSFPDDWLEDADYITAAESGNVIEFFLNWLINQHNAQVQEFQRFKLGKVTVTDPNNYLSRSDSNYPSTWEVLKSKLFDSALGGYLCIRYEVDGNYIDYVSGFELTNTQEIVFGENLLDLKTDSDATETYSAIIPIGATIETESTDEDGNPVTNKTILTIESLPDGDITDDIVKKGDMIYSRSAVEAYGWIFAPVKETTWDDVTNANNLLSKSVEFLVADGMMLSETVEAVAADLHFTDDQVQSFRIYRNVKVRSDPHGHNSVYQLTKLGLDLQNPQNTKITVGSTKRTLTDLNASQKNEADQRIESVRNELIDFVSKKATGIEQKIEGIDGLFFYIKYSPYEDGHFMTNAPDEFTLYMGTCSTNKETAPEDYREYTWCRVRGSDGKDGADGTPGADGTDGSSQYFHVKYSNDGKTFTANNGETLGDWMGTLVDSNQADSTVFSAYTWKKIVGEDGQDGIDGVDGKAGTSAYFYVKFSANADGSGMTETPAENTKYMGVCSTTSATAPTDPAAYDWTQCRGDDGTDGTPGEPGEDGRTQYLHIKYSDDGATFSGNILSGDADRWFSGLISNSSLTTIDTPPSAAAGYISFDSAIPVMPGDALSFSASTSATAYPHYYDELGVFHSRGDSIWSSVNTPTKTLTIPDGVYYVRFSLAMNGCSSFEDFQNAFESGELKPYLWKSGVVLGEELGAYIGTLVDFVEADSETFSDYTWKKFTEDVDEELDEIRKTIVDQYTEVLNDAERITLRALESYVETSNFEEFKRTLTAELEVWAGGIAGRVSATETSIKDVDGDLQEKFNTITKYFTFDINGMTIGQVDNPNKVVIDNDQISILVNGIPVQEFKADGTALIPSLKITLMLSLLGLQITEDENNINCDYMGV